MTDLLLLTLVRLASPAPVALAIVLLSFPHGRRKAWVFVGGWFLGGLMVMGPALWLARSTSLGAEHSPVVAWGKVGFGAVFVGLAAWTGWRMWRDGGGRPPGKWVERVEQASTWWILGVGLGFGVVGGPKNLAVLLQAPLMISRGGHSTVVDLGLVLAVDAISTIGVVLPVVVAMLWPERTDTLLQRGKAWLVRHTRAILLVIFAVAGPLLLVRGILELVG